MAHPTYNFADMVGEGSQESDGSRVRFDCDLIVRFSDSPACIWASHSLMSRARSRRDTLIPGPGLATLVVGFRGIADLVIVAESALYVF